MSKKDEAKKVLDELSEEEIRQILEEKRSTKLAELRKKLSEAHAEVKRLEKEIASITGVGPVEETKKSSSGSSRLSKMDMERLQKDIQKIVENNPGGIQMNDIVDTLNRSEGWGGLTAVQVRNAVNKLITAKSIKKRGERAATVYLP